MELYALICSSISCPCFMFHINLFTDYDEHYLSVFILAQVMLRDSDCNST
jgi:hypothetical protein